MTTTTARRDADEIRTWRDFADKLTEEQVRQLQALELDLDPDRLHAAAEVMLAETEAQHRYAHIPLPPGTTQASPWEDDGGWSRLFRGTVTEITGYMVGVFGIQWTDGRLEAHPVMTAPPNPKEDLTRVESLQMAVALIDAVIESQSVSVASETVTAPDPNGEETTMTTADCLGRVWAECEAREAAFADTPLPRGTLEVGGYVTTDPLVRGCVLTNYDPPVGFVIFGDVHQHTDGTGTARVVYDTGQCRPNSGNAVLTVSRDDDHGVLCRR